MKLVAADCAMEVVPLEGREDVRLAVTVSTPDFRGSYDEVWVDRARLERFTGALRRLEAERSGEAVLESWSPGEFRLAFRVVGTAGRIAATVALTRQQYGRFGRYPNSIGCDFEVPGDALGEWIAAFEREFAISSPSHP